tara:strand:+ start:984 stop:1418 length:435 start_codon:yes stop_codon:yes gene_type:complete
MTKDFAIYGKSDLIVDQILTAVNESEASNLYDTDAYHIREVSTDVCGIGKPDPSLDNFAQIGWKWDESLNRFYLVEAPDDNHIQNATKRWQPKVDPPDEFIVPPVHPFKEVSRRWVWEPNQQQWIARDPDYVTELISKYGESNS